MSREVYRYNFNRSVTFKEALATLDLAIIAVQSLHGESRTRMDARFTSDESRCALVIDASTPIGQVLNQVFVGYSQREFGEGSFSVRRCEATGDSASSRAEPSCTSSSAAQ